MNEMDLKFNKMIILFIVNRNFRIPEMFFDCIHVYLRHSLNCIHVVS